MNAPYCLLVADALKVWEPAPEDALIDEYLNSGRLDFFASLDFPLGGSFAGVVKWGEYLPRSNRHRAEIERCVVRARKAMDEQNMDALDGWLVALFAVSTYRAMAPKFFTKLRQENAIRSVQKAGTQAGKDKANDRKARLHKDINDYLNYHPDALAKGNAACLHFLVERNLTYDYAKTTILNSDIKQLFAAKRKAMKAEN